MPVISLEQIDFNLALSNIISSIALEETAIANILNANASLLEMVESLIDPESGSFNSTYPTGGESALADLLAANTEVNQTLDVMQTLESVLRSKLCCVIDHLLSTSDSEEGGE